MVRSTARREEVGVISVLLGLLVAVPAVAVQAHPEVGAAEELEIAVGGADAVVEGLVVGVVDTFIVTRHERPGRAGRPETWIQVRVLSKLKGPLGIGPGSIVHAVVGPEDPRLDDPSSLWRGDHTSLFFLLRNDPGRFLPGLIASPWVLVGPSWLDSRDAKAQRSRVEKIVHRQSRESLVRRADVVVVAHPSGEERRCRDPNDGTCLTLAVDSVLAGRLPSRSIPIAIRGFGIPGGPAIYFLRKSASGRHGLVGKSAGVLSPPTLTPSDWFPVRAETIRRQWYRWH